MRNATVLMAGKIFVFGSNLAGRHGAGAALYARNNCGAIYGQAEGLQGRSYGIPTRDRFIRTLPLEQIAPGVSRFVAFAIDHPELVFYLTPVGTGFAGYQHREMAPLFAGIPANVEAPQEWLSILAPRPI